MKVMKRPKQFVQELSKYSNKNLVLIHFCTQVNKTEKPVNNNVGHRFLQALHKCYSIVSPILAAKFVLRFPETRSPIEPRRCKNFERRCTPFSYLTDTCNQGRI